MLLERVAEEAVEGENRRRSDHVVEEQLSDRQPVDQLAGTDRPTHLPRHDLLDYRLSHAFAPSPESSTCQLVNMSTGKDNNRRPVPSKLTDRLSTNRRAIWPTIHRGAHAPGRSCPPP